MRELDVKVITENIKEMCIEATHFLTEDMKNVLDDSVTKEESPLGKQILQQLQENLQIAGDEMIPICQDTGMAVVFIKVGQDVHFTGGNIEDAINEGVRLDRSSAASDVYKRQGIYGRIFEKIRSKRSYYQGKYKR